MPVPGALFIGAADEEFVTEEAADSDFTGVPLGSIKIDLKKPRRQATVDFGNAMPQQFHRSSFTDCVISKGRLP
jgi:hypothetical protein